MVCGWPLELAWAGGAPQEGGLKDWGVMDLGASARSIGRAPVALAKAAGCHRGRFSATGAFAALATGWQQMLGKRISALKRFQENLRISQQWLDRGHGQKANPPPRLQRAREVQHHLLHAALRAHGFPQGKTSFCHPSFPAAAFTPILVQAAVHLLALSAAAKSSSFAVLVIH